MIVRILRTTLGFTTILLLLAAHSAAQPITDGEGDVGVGTLIPHRSALLELSSTTKGFLLSRMTTEQRDRIVRPSTGLMIYNLNDSSMQINCGDEEVPVWCPFVLEKPGGGLSSLLSPGALWYGGADSTPTELAAGSAGSLLTSNGSGPVWQANPGGLLPPGTTDHSVLVWDATANGGTGGWVENTQLISNPADGNTMVGGGLAVDGDQVNNGNLTVNGDVDFPLPENHIWVGNGANRAEALSPGSDGSLLTIAGTAPQWLANPGGLLPGGTVNNSTLRWDGSAWVENTGLVSDASGNTTVDGSVISVPNIPTTVTGSTVLVADGAGNLQTIDVNDLIANATLTQNALWTGSPAHAPAELLSTNVPGSILVQDGIGAPVWVPAASTPFWALSGNSGTSPAANFLGTTDAASLAFRTNNVERARFDEANGGDFVPGSDNTYGLGSAALRWQDLYLGPGSLHLMSTAAETVTEREWILGIEESGFPTAEKRGNLQVLSGATEVINVTPGGRVGIGSNFSGNFAHQIDATLTVQGDAIISRHGLTGSIRRVHLSDQSDQPFFFRFLRVNEADFRMYEALNDQIRFQTGGSSGSPDLLRGGFRFDIVSTAITRPILYMDTTGLGVNISGTGNDRPLHYLHVRNTKTADELAGVYSVVEGISANQTAGIWGDARNSTNGNTGTIGVLATGNARVTPGQTNIALQVNDGEITVGRTGQTGVGYSVVETAAGGTAYTAEGPSGVIELTLGAGGNLVTAVPTGGAFQNLGIVTVNNPYARTTSIVHAQVIDKTDDGAQPSPENAVFLADIDNRAAGSFQIRVGMIPTVTSAQNYQNGDVIRIGYTIVNPSR